MDSICLNRHTHSQEHSKAVYIEQFLTKYKLALFSNIIIVTLTYTEALCGIENQVWLVWSLIIKTAFWRIPSKFYRIGLIQLYCNMCWTSSHHHFPILPNTIQLLKITGRDERDIGQMVCIWPILQGMSAFVLIPAHRFRCLAPHQALDGSTVGIGLGLCTLSETIVAMDNGWHTSWLI